MSDFFHLHAHSHYSVLDAIPTVESMVKMAKRRRQPGLALTDHGTMAGSVRLYKECKAQGLVPFPGIEAYFVTDTQDKEAKRHHLTLLALNKRGYEGLVRLTTETHKRENYHYKPRMDWKLLAELRDSCSKDVVVLTGCYFGLLVQTLIKQDEITATALVKTLRRMFPHTYVEIQAHNIHRPDFTETELNSTLREISRQAGVPMVVTQDSHYTDARHKPMHDLLKRMVIRSDDDAAFPGDSYHLASSEWVEKHYTKGFNDVWHESLGVMETLLEANTLALPAVDQYRIHVPNSGVTKPLDQLRVNVVTELTTMAQHFDHIGEQYDEYLARVEEEIEVIGHHGMADYFLLVADYVRWCWEEEILVNARGSANGSLVCYLLGITQIDPMQWGLMFERFLSRDRSKPPDIDLDIEDTARDAVIEYISTKHDIRQIGTYNTLGQDRWGKGSIMVQYMSWKRRTMDKEEFRQRFSDITTLDDLAEIEPEDAEGLKALAEFRVRKSAGSHAAGFVVSGQDQPIGEYIPTMLIPSSGLEVTQMVGDDIEEMGYVKIDLLGQRTLTTVKRCLEMIGKNPREGLEWIPNDDKRTLAFMRKGRPDTGIFQFEGYTNARGCRELGVRSTQECVVVTSLYRPATLDLGYKDLYLSNRAGLTDPRYPHPIFKKHLERTHGVAIYQEQILAILKEIGVPNEELNLFLKALKMSNDKAVKAAEFFRKYKNDFITLMGYKGLSAFDAAHAWELVSGFAGYGFNEAHGTAYGLLGYRTAYLKVHHPLEYMTALLQTTAGTQSEEKYVKEARRMQLSLLPADVNISSYVWTLDRDNQAIRRGLNSIKGVGTKAAQAIVEGQPYTSLQDFMDRTPSRLVTGSIEWPVRRAGVMKALWSAGAFMSLGESPLD